MTTLSGAASFLDQVIKLPGGGELLFIPHFIQTATADRLFARLQAELSWTQSNIHLFGRRVAEPRLTAWYADPGTHYAYSGRYLMARPWPACLAELRHQVSQVADQSFNAVLGNLYRDGDDYMGWHSDAESSLGTRPVIASVSLGEQRPFMLRKKQDHSVKYSLDMLPGSLLIMRGETQKYWQHALPRRKRIIKPRINLTFRYIYQRPN